jgi:hypothetical protein
LLAVVNYIAPLGALEPIYKTFLSDLAGRQRL